MKRSQLPLVIAALFLVSAMSFVCVSMIVKMRPQQTPPEAMAVEPPKPKAIPIVQSSDVEANINQLREDKGLPTFKSNVTALDQAAQARAESMCATNNWSHQGDWAMLDKYYAYSYAGENLYFGPLQKNQAAEAVHDWSMSPTHLKNLLSEYTEIGVGVKSCPGFQGNKTAVIITNYFGVPR